MARRSSPPPAPASDGGVQITAKRPDWIDGAVQFELAAEARVSVGDAVDAPDSK
jgi:hypothetical protein